ncbi:hypothetical protein [Sulfitobacter sp. S190]|uniref:hypothetical protein n=1 Tax=Sulfitobacter sp. S190 TaxID=2867022 RepID=UPI0021A480D2|nr:hypothetical protein [Sulfitobacter sp. S190]UWR22301.1 hypothetical protein K3756_16795 [Sulfitobacter sp. S190]
MKQIDDRALIGARNNADLYEAVFRAHGLRFRRPPHAFFAVDKPPPYYATVSLTAPIDPGSFLAELADTASLHGRTLTVKDSFDQLDLGPFGFERLFTSQWIYRRAQPVALPDGWRLIADADELRAWEAGWRGSPLDTDAMFPPNLLDLADIRFLGRANDGNFRAGCIANLSADCIGLSNVFDTDKSPEMFAEAALAAGSLDGNRPVVGYERADTLDSARRIGFDAVGPLTVWSSSNAQF